MLIIILQPGPDLSLQLANLLKILCCDNGNISRSLGGGQFSFQWKMSINLNDLSKKLRNISQKLTILTILVKNWTSAINCSMGNGLCVKLE